MSRNNMPSVNITSMYMASDRVIAEHNQRGAEQARGTDIEQCLVTKALGELL